jgi:pimeloyl-ACP methyl ester carboxylesterase
MKESSCRFGEHGQLAGIVTESDAAPRAALVLVSAGLTPKFGPFRLYVELARRLAAEGYLTLRFDLGGIGDSGQGYSGRPLKERTELEIKAALDFLSARGAPKSVWVGGLCSGAEDSFRFAERDERVAGLVLMDPFGYKTAGWKRRDLAIRAVRRALWLSGLLPTYRSAASEGGLIDYASMGRAEAGRILRTLIRRKVPMHFVYTGGMRETFNHKGQFKAMFEGIDFQGLAAVDYFPQLRHTQALEADRHTIIEAITARLATQERI